MDATPPSAASTSRHQLSLWDAISLIVGIVVGSSIYQAPPLIFANVPSAAIGLALWLLGGVLCLLGALIYAELATTYPRCGGEYNYLSRAYGPWLGFLFAWSQLAVIQTASIGALSYVFADYGLELWDLPESFAPWLAGAAVIVLTLVNLCGLRMGARIQNLLTILKIVGLTAIVVAGVLYGSADPLASVPTSQGPGWTLALIFILYAYGGWSDAGFVAAEVKNVSKNVPRALVTGLGLITLTYLIVNFAYLRALGAAGLAESSRPAAQTLALLAGQRGSQFMCLLVMASALGAVNGLIFAASRVHVMLGEDYRSLRWLGGFSRSEAPIASLILQCLVTVTMILLVGTATGREGLNFALATLGIAAIPWSQYGHGFETLVVGSAPAFWLFFVLNACGFVWLRIRDAARPRPFRVPCYQLTAAIFIATCGWMLYSSAKYAWPLIPIISLPLLAGVPVYWLVRNSRKANPDECSMISSRAPP